jgi:6-pyruvoyl-tetrahydropterin synthase
MRLFVDQLTTVDFSYLCPDRGLVGETWLAQAELEGPLDDEGMVCDFGRVKKVLRTWLDTQLDHRLLVPEHCAGTQVTPTDASGARLKVVFPLRNGLRISTESPAEAITRISSSYISPRQVAKWCEDFWHTTPGELTRAFGAGVDRIKLSFVTEALDTPFYHYSHGLKKHRGNCQRIAHGHRSKLLIYRNGQLDHDAIEHWALRFCDSYLATQSDLIAEDADYCHFAYSAQQGDFSLSLPRSACYFLPTDTTVEWIAQHLFQQLKSAHPNDHFCVRAFEGLGKGAIAEG